MALDTEVDICNAALSRAGISKRIESLSDATVEAEACDAEYAGARDAVLEDHPWQFAVKYVTLAEDGSSPKWYWNRQYTLPNDYMMLLNLESEEIAYEITADLKLLTDEGAPLKIRYTSRVTDPSKMPQSFKQAVVLRLASYIAVSLTKDLDRANFLEQKYEKQVADARFADGSRRSYQPLDSSAFQDARHIGPERINSEGDLN